MYPSPWRVIPFFGEPEAFADAAAEGRDQDAFETRVRLRALGGSTCGAIHAARI